MDISTNQADDVTVVTFRGSFDTNTAPDGQTKLEEVLDAGAKKILVDFADLDYISSAGLRVLLAIGKKLSAVGGGLRVCSLNETVAEVFEISGFNTIFRVFDDREAALRDF